MNVYHPEFSDFVARYRGPGLDNAKRYFAHGAPEPDEITTLANVPRWTSVRFPKELALQTGELGWSVPTSELLKRVSAFNGESDLGRYYEWLAERLGVAGPEPVFADLEPHYRAALLAWSELEAAVLQDPEALSDRGRVWLGVNLREARVLADRWLHDRLLYVPLPADHPAPAGSGGEPLAMLAVDVGAEMTAVAEELEASNPDRAAQLKAIVDRWYPDQHIEVEVRNADEHFWLTGFRTVDLGDYSPEYLAPIAGSIRLDHYGANSAYSPDSATHGYRVHGVHQDLEPGESIQSCLLICDTHALEAEVSWD